MNDDIITILKRESNLRKLMHPDWPSHKTTIQYPHGEVEMICEVLPVGKAEGMRGYCKYCYTTHANWWAMDPRETTPEQGPLLLCGECEYTILQVFIPARAPHIRRSR